MHLGFDPRNVGRHLAVDVLGAPTQNGRNHFGDLTRAVHAAVRILDRDPHPPRQDVLEVQRALGRRGVPRLHLQIHRRLGDRRQQFRPALGHRQHLADQRAVAVQQVAHPIRMQAVMRTDAFGLVDQREVAVGAHQWHLLGDRRRHPGRDVLGGGVDRVGRPSPDRWCTCRLRWPPGPGRAPRPRARATAWTFPRSPPPAAGAARRRPRRCRRGSAASPARC